MRKKNEIYGSSFAKVVIDSSKTKILTDASKLKIIGSLDITTKALKFKFEKL